MSVVVFNKVDSKNILSPFCTSKSSSNVVVIFVRLSTGREINHGGGAVYLKVVEALEQAHRLYTASSINSIAVETSGWGRLLIVV